MTASRLANAMMKNMTFQNSATRTWRKARASSLFSRLPEVFAPRFTSATETDAKGGSQARRSVRGIFADGVARTPRRLLPDRKFTEKYRWHAPC